MKMKRHNRQWVALLTVILCLFFLTPLPTRSQDAPPQKIESDDPAVSQEGAWTVQTANEASGSAYLFSSGAEIDALTLEFSGPSVEILYGVGPGLGTLVIEVDGTVLRTVITTAEATAYQQSAKIGYLTDEAHTLKVYAQGSGVVAIDAFVTDLPHPPTPSPNLERGSQENTQENANFETRTPSCEPQNSIHRLSRASNGTQGDLDSRTPAISSTGRYVAFVSDAANLVAGDTNGVADIFVRDRQTCLTTRVSVVTGGTQADGSSSEPAISADGRYVVFASVATNLVASDTNGVSDIFIHDRQLGQTARLSVATGGAQVAGASTDPAISADGNSVVFRSTANNLVGGDTNGQADIFLRNRTTNETTRVSISDTEVQSENACANPDVSADGRYVTFETNAANIIADDTNNQTDIFVRDRTAGTTIRASVTDGEGEGNAASVEAEISSNGRYVVFRSNAVNLVAGDTNSRQDIFVRDLVGGTTVRASSNSAGVQGNDHAFWGSISDDGRYVAFESDSTNLVTGDTNSARDVFIKDLTSGTTIRATVNAANNESINADISADGSGVAYESAATTLVNGDTNGARDTFARQRVVSSLAPVDTLALFRPTTNAIGLIDTLTTNPPAANLLIYNETPPVNGQWVMGDWNGDGQKTPGIYGSTGAFFYTNNLGTPTSGPGTWTGIWIGLVGRPAVVGHFDFNVPNDCIGVVDSANFPPFGTAFSMYFTCNLTSGPTPTLSNHWISVVLPDSTGATGTHQFAAGDFDDNGSDSIAVRRGAFIAWTNVNPTILESAFNQAQYIGAPSSNDYGIFVAGNWNPAVDAFDSFGLVYQNGHFYRRDDLDWNSQTYTLQQVGQPIGTPFTAVTWQQR